MFNASPGQSRTVFGDARHCYGARGRRNARPARVGFRPQTSGCHLPRRAILQGMKTEKKKARKPVKASKTAPKKAGSGAKKSATPKFAARADFGEPIDGFIGKQPAHLRSILEELRRLVEEVAPEAQSSLKWGMPVYTVNGAMMCALAGHKSHVNFVLSGPSGTFPDPEGLLAGEGKTGRHLKLTSLDQLPRDAVRGWLRRAAEVAGLK